MQEIEAKTIISGYSSNDGWFGSNYNMNIYKGCCHGCIYCDSRSDCYRIENFDEVRVKKDALQIIEKELKFKRNKGIIGTGAMTDHYNPFEKKLELMRGALTLINRFQFGISIDTKSDLVTRDIDLLLKIKEHSPVHIGFTITTLDDTLCKKIEQNVCVTSKRLDSIKKLSDAGITAGVLLMPVLPFINDNVDNILGIVNAASTAGAKYVFAYGGFGVTLRQNQRQYFFDKLDKEFPSVKQKYINQFGYEYSCRSPLNEKLCNIFKSQCDKLGLKYKMEDIINLIKKPYEKKQLSLFDIY